MSVDYQDAATLAALETFKESLSNTYARARHYWLSRLAADIRAVWTRDFVNGRGKHQTQVEWDAERPDSRTLAEWEADLFAMTKPTIPILFVNNTVANATTFTITSTTTTNTPPKEPTTMPKTRIKHAFISKARAERCPQRKVNIHNPDDYNEIIGTGYITNKVGETTAHVLPVDIFGAPMPVTAISLDRLSWARIIKSSGMREAVVEGRGWNGSAGAGGNDGVDQGYDIVCAGDVIALIGHDDKKEPLEAEGGVVENMDDYDGETYTAAAIFTRDYRVEPGVSEHLLDLEPELQSEIRSLVWELEELRGYKKP